MRKSPIFILWFLPFFTNKFVSSQYINGTESFMHILNKDFQHFRRNARGIFGSSLGRLISFDAKNDDVNVGLEFSVPFVSIPVKKTLDTMKSMGSSTTQFVTNPIMNINAGAVGLTGTVVLAGALTTFLWKSYVQHQFNRFAGGRRSDSNEAEKDGFIGNLFGTIEKLLEKHDIDTVSCTQKAVCTFVRDAARNVKEGKGTSTEKIVDGFLSANWIHQFIKDSAIADAIAAAKNHANCAYKFNGCRLKSRNFKKMIEKMIRELID